MHQIYQNHFTRFRCMHSAHLHTHRKFDIYLWKLYRNFNTKYYTFLKMKWLFSLIKNLNSKNWVILFGILIFYIYWFWCADLNEKYFYCIKFRLCEGYLYEILTLKTHWNRLNWFIWKFSQNKRHPVDWMKVAVLNVFRLK